MAFTRLSLILLSMDKKARLVEMAVAVCYLAEVMVAFTLMLGHGLWKSLAGK